MQGLTDDDERDKLIDDLGSLFEDDDQGHGPDQEILDEMDNRAQADEEIVRNGQKMKEDLIKARELISSGMHQVRQLKRMVSETKQSLKDQKRLEYLENLYKEKILADEQEKEAAKQMQNPGNMLKKDKNRLSFVDNKRRLQSAYRTGGMVNGICIPKQVCTTGNSRLAINPLALGQMDFAVNSGHELEFGKNNKSNKNLFANHRKNSNTGMSGCGAASYAE